MKRSGTLSFFKIGILLLINTYLRNPFLFAGTVILLLLSDLKETAIFLILSLFLVFYNSLGDFIPFGYIDQCTERYVIVDKIFYKTKVYTDKGDIGDVVYTVTDKVRKNDKDNIKNNIRFVSEDELKIISINTPLKLSYEHLKTLNDENRIICERYLFNSYADDGDYGYYLGYGFCFYYLLKMIFRKNRCISLSLMIIYILFFGFEIKFILIITEFLLSFFDLRNIDELGIKVIIICIINYELIRNYSILLPLMFSLITYLDLNNKFVISLIQSLLFGSVNLFMSFLFRYCIYAQILLFLCSLIIFIFPVSSVLFLKIIRLLGEALRLLSFTVRGRVSLLTLFILFILYRSFKTGNPYLYTAIMIFCLLLPANDPLEHVSFIDVGQGDSILLRGFLHSYTVLIDTGSEYNYSKLRNYLYGEGIYTIDYLIISHDDSDHNGNIDNLQQDFRIKNIIDRPTNVTINELELKNVYLGDFGNDNDNSLVYYTQIDDHSFLFTGDISEDVERLLIKESGIEDIDILKISHHGSYTATSSYFVGKLLPEYAVISTDGSYGHPHNEVLETLDSYHVKTYITKDSGTVVFYFTDLIDFIKTANNDFDIINS